MKVRRMKAGRIKARFVQKGSIKIPKGSSGGGRMGVLRRRSGPRIHPASPSGCGRCRSASLHVSFGHGGASAEPAARGAWGGLREGGKEKKKPPWEGMGFRMEEIWMHWGSG